MDFPGFITTAFARDKHRKPLLTRRRLAVFGTTLILAGLLIGLFERSGTEPGSDKPRSMDLAIPDRELAVPALEEETGPVPAPVPDEEPWDSVTVRNGQTLDGIFRQEGFSIALLHRILALSEETGGLVKIRPGDVFEFRRGAEGTLAAMRYPLDEASYLVVENGEEGLRANVLEREIIAEITETQGVIRSSLFLAGKAAGLSDAMIMELANIFGWDIDFVLDIREGDRFMLVYEKLYREGEFLRDGRILAATFINQGEHFRAVWFEEGEVADYFAPDGRNMRKAFLRAPLNFSYISSSFNPRRLHPVLKTVRPHRGIDYRAPPGTPVYAAGDGTVTRSAYDKSNGHHVFIKHAGSIVTKYLHFTKRMVRKGQKVKQGQTIGTVGSTGLATGPHLHYEFVVNGVHRNPRTVPLPKVEPLEAELLKKFQAHAAPMLTQLSRMESASLYADQN